VRSADGELVVAEVEDDVAESRQVRPAVRRRADRQAKIGRSGMFERMSPREVAATSMA